MKENVYRIRICPSCKRAYGQRPALSRVDNQTMICPDCGARQALASLGVGPEEQEQIIAIIHASQRHNQC